mmetsp:Transcript_6364/g.9281  ORF Transcript_6364/g.9281 Transcript_6364/m.9281 type:complete len:156 (-) Transcript_6364:2079-2546(-)
MKNVILFLVFVASSVSAFVPQGRNHPLIATQLHIFGPKQALEIERAKNPKAVEATIQGLMKQKRLTREQAEKRYGEFLNDPDGFALRAGEETWKREGYRNWEEAAVGRSADPEATAARIAKFKRDSQLKGVSIMTLGSALLLWYASQNPYVPPGH